MSRNMILPLFLNYYTSQEYYNEVTVKPKDASRMDGVARLNIVKSNKEQVRASGPLTNHTSERPLKSPSKPTIATLI